MSFEWANAICRSWGNTNAKELLEYLMSQPECPPFGPVHHYLVGAALITCARESNKGALLDERLHALEKQAVQIPGAVCAKWGICGAALSCGIAYSILAETSPVKAKGWSEGQQITAAISQQIAHAGAPRCCKRDSRIAIHEASKLFNQAFGLGLDTSQDVLKCDLIETNNVCIQEQCPFFARSVVKNSVNN